jgi:hypothetical protein
VLLFIVHLLCSVNLILCLHESAAHVPLSGPCTGQATHAVEAGPLGDSQLVAWAACIRGPGSPLPEVPIPAVIPRVALGMSRLRPVRELGFVRVVMLDVACDLLGAEVADHCGLPPLAEPKPTFAQADVPLLSDDQVIKQFDVEHLPSLNQLPRHLHVLR